MSMHERINPALDAPASRCPRRAAEFKAFATREDGEIIDLVITDLSYDGCGISSEAELRIGERLQLAVTRRGTAPAVVRWSMSGKAGLRFVEEEEGTPEPAHIPRRHQRISAEGEVTMRRAGKLPFRVHIYDLTPGGCRAEFVERPLLNELLWIKFDQLGTIEAKVRWIAGPRTGLEFVRPIHEAVFDLIVARHGVQASES